MSDVEQRLTELGITLPPAPAAVAMYEPCLQSGNLLHVSGMLPMRDGALAQTGKLGAEVTVEEGAELARLCALNALAAVRAHLGSLDRIEKAVRLGGFVASAPGFTQQPQVINGASQLLRDVFGEAGRHARAAVGVAELPLGAPVEVEFLFQVRA